MTFEAFPRDALQSYEDPGVYYVNEKGKLRSPPGVGFKASRTDDLDNLAQSPPGIINGIFLANRHRTMTLETCYDGTTRNVYHPKKLFDISLMFVADNIGLVESFAGFPEIVGEQLFITAMELGKFANYETALTALQLFYEAYGRAVLESLSLRDRHTVFSEHLDCVLLFTGLTALDLGGCGLGNDHEILAVIGNMYCLQDLCLCDNRLSDDSIQKMTSPLRILERGPKHLQALDLAGNSLLTDMGVKYLSAFTSLMLLDLSGCCVSAHGIARIQSRIPSLRAADTDDEKSRFPITIDNRGWAVPLVHSWLCSAKPEQTGENALKTKSRAATFYGRMTVIPLPVFTEVENKQRQPIIRLVADPTTSTSDILAPQAKRYKKSSPLKPTSPNKIKSNCSPFKNSPKTKVKLKTNPKDQLKVKSKGKFSRLKSKCTRNSAGSKQYRGGNTKLKMSRSAGDDVDDEEEEKDDLMRSYLQARDREKGSSSQGSLWGAMNSQSW